MYNFSKEIESEIGSGFVVIKFFATWCGPCKRISPIVEKLESEFDICKFIAVDTDEFPDIISTYGVKSLPTILFLKDGVEVKRVAGVSLIDPLRKILREMVG